MQQLVGSGGDAWNLPDDQDKLSGAVGWDTHGAMTTKNEGGQGQGDQNKPM